MKKLLFLLPLILFIFFFLPLVNASGSSCIVSGYDWCWKNSNSGASAKVYGTNPGPPIYVSNDNVYASPKNGSELYLTLGFIGDKLYYYPGLTRWSKVNCDEDGCDGTSISSGKYVIAKVGESYKDCYGFVAWDKNDNSWAWAGYGWVSTDCPTYKLVDCFKDSNCRNKYGALYYCDNSSSDWTKWKCIFQPQCTEGDVRYGFCQNAPNYIFARCINGTWATIYYSLNPCIYQNQTTNISIGTEGVTEQAESPLSNFITMKIFSIGGFDIQLWMLVVFVILIWLMIPK